MDGGLRILDSGRELIKGIYCIRYPDYEKFGLQSQIRRAVISINLNIVEGNARRTPKDFLSFCYIAKGSAEEVRECLVLSKELKFIFDCDFNTYSDKLDSVTKQLSNLIKYLKSKIQHP